MKPVGPNLARLVALALLTPCLYGGCVGSDNVVVATGQKVDKLIEIEILPREGTTDVYLSASKKTLELLIRGTYSDQSQKMIDAETAEWSPISGAAGQISVRGQFTAVQRGTSEIEARLGLVKDRIYLRVFD